MPHDTVILRADMLWEFGRVLRSPNPPTLAQFVASYRDIPVPDLVELIMIEQCARWAGGKRVLVEYYLDQFPHLADQHDELVSLLGYEYELRQLHGDSPRPEQYYERFPLLHRSLKEHFRVCDVLARSRASELGEAPQLRNVPSKFSLVAVHAEGGLGRVWLARDCQLDREVAVKELR